MTKTVLISLAVLTLASSTALAILDLVAFRATRKTTWLASESFVAFSVMTGERITS